MEVVKRISRVRMPLSEEQERHAIAAYTAVKNGDVEKIIVYLSGNRICTEEVPRVERKRA